MHTRDAHGDSQQAAGSTVLKVGEITPNPLQRTRNDSLEFPSNQQAIENKHLNNIGFDLIWY